MSVPRPQSPISLYHILIQGDNKQPIFSAPSDYQFYLALLNAIFPDNHTAGTGTELKAYCLLPNHVHLLLHTNLDPRIELGRVVTQLSSPYAYYFNNKYKRMGHVFQEKYRSEAIMNQERCDLIFNYIHACPLEFGLTDTIRTYPYSSVAYYPDVQFAPLTAQEESVMTINDQQPIKRLTAPQTQRILLSLSGCSSIHDFHLLPTDDQRRYASDVKQRGASVRILSTLTGMSTSTIQKL